MADNTKKADAIGENVMPNKQLIAFYLGMEPCANGSMLKDILQNWDDEKLEKCHDYIQWLFPTAQPSQFNSNAPQVDGETIKAWKESRILQSTLLEALDRMCTFYGLQVVVSVSPAQIIKAANYLERKSNWQDAPPGHANHNLLRLTRIIDSLVTLGLPQYGRALYVCLSSIAAVEPERISEKTVSYWRKAAIRKFELPNMRRSEKEILGPRCTSPDSIDRCLLGARGTNATLYEKRHFAFRALEEAERLGNSEVTEENLKPLRTVLNFISRNCKYDVYELKDRLQPVQMKLEPGYAMGPDMFSALFTEAAKYQLQQDEGYGFAKTLALNALRVEINVDLKKQHSGADNTQGIRQALLLLADVYEKVSDTHRADQVREQAGDLC